MPKILVIAASLSMVCLAPPHAHAAERIRVELEVRLEGAPVGNAIENQLRTAVRRELEALGDIEIVAPGAASDRLMWVLAAANAGLYSASVIATEHYDRPTLMVLGIEDDDLAGRMMALQIVNDHQIFTGADLSELAQRIVESLNTGVLARVRARAPVR